MEDGEGKFISKAKCNSAKFGQPYFNNTYFH